MRTSRCACLAILLAGLLHAITPAEQAPPDALKFFKNYFVTGSYVVGGVGLRGKGVGGVATGFIGVPTVQEGADLVAAFLYWQVVTKDPTGAQGAARVTFGPWSATAPPESIVPGTGIPLSTTDGPLGKALGAGSPPCWSGGGGTGGGGTWKTFTYRADVLRFLHIDGGTGKFNVNGYYQVQLPDDNSVTALGASLVVIYRDPDPLAPLNAIVLYDGTYTMDQSSQRMDQSIKGFYDRKAGTARLTHIVGSGQVNKSEILYFNGTEIARNSFASTLGANWDNPTFTVSAGLSSDPGQVTTSVDHQGFSTFDCLTWAAVIYETPVKDTDDDGLLDAWEMATEARPLKDPMDKDLPYLGDMGANPNQKDLFVQVGWMTTGDLLYSYGAVENEKPAHSHKPTPAAIKLVGDAFKRAPLDCDGQGQNCKGVRLHVDAGDSYPVGSEADEYLIRGSGNPVPYRYELDEAVATAAGCELRPGDPVWKCQFQQHPGTVGWKTGLHYIKSDVIGTTDQTAIPLPPTDPAADDPCDLPGNTCVRRFEPNRAHMFRYTFFAHAVGMPKSLNACFDKATNTEQPDVEGQCPAPLEKNPLFFTPRTNSGIGDFPGRDVLVTLGAFSDRFGRPGGTDFMVASTWFHELGHNMALRHGAWQEEGGKIQPGPNCVPTYLSAMNYLYQLRGLLDDAGKPHLDFARAPAAVRLDEAGGSDEPLPWTPSVAPPYRIGWYAPLKDSYFADPDHPDDPTKARTTVASRHCDGSPLNGADAWMVRVDARTAAGIIDWNANGLPDGYAFQDLNFNGRTEQQGPAPELPPAVNDWAIIRLNQIGAARNIGGPFVDAAGRNAFGPLSADLARADWARADWARADWARADWARADWARADWARADWGDLGQGDLGRYSFARADWARADWARADWARADWARADWGRGDDGRGDYGGGDLFIKDPNNHGGELDFETATLLGNTPPYEFTACIGTQSACGDGSGVLTTWKPTNEGNELSYIVYRVTGPVLAPGQTWTPVATVNAVPGQADYSAFDGSSLQKGLIYLYFAVALYDRGLERPVQSEPSNVVAIPGPNRPPVAVDDTYPMPSAAGEMLTVPARGVLSNDGDVDSSLAVLTAVLVTQASHGALSFNDDGSFTYTPNEPVSASDSFTYQAKDEAGALSNVATVRIAGYLLHGLQNVPPATIVKSKAGSSVPMKWQYRNGSAVVVNSAAVGHTVTVTGPPGETVRTVSNTDPGSSTFRYDNSTNTWYFNLQTKDLNGVAYPVGSYEVRITPNQPGYLASPVFNLTLTK